MSDWVEDPRHNFGVNADEMRIYLSFIAFRDETGKLEHNRMSDVHRAINRALPEINPTVGSRSRVETWQIFGQALDIWDNMGDTPKDQLGRFSRAAFALAADKHKSKGSAIKELYEVYQRKKALAPQSEWLPIIEKYYQMAGIT